jgi:hypothetical protein
MGDMRSRPLFLAPGDVVDAVVHRQRHELVVGGVKADLVEPSSIAVEGGQFRRVTVGELAPLEHLFGADGRAQLGQRRFQPFAALAQGGFPEARIRSEQVHSDALRRLVGDLVGREPGRRCVSGHDASPAVGRAAMRASGRSCNQRPGSGGPSRISGSLQRSDAAALTWINSPVRHLQALRIGPSNRPERESGFDCTDLAGSPAEAFGEGW